MKTLIIRQVREGVNNGPTEIIGGIPDDMPTDKVVTAYQKHTLYYWATHKLPPVKFKLAEKADMVSAMIETARF